MNLSVNEKRKVGSELNVICTVKKLGEFVETPQSLFWIFVVKVQNMFGYLIKKP